ncbi:MAG TPA: hypothetical protein VF265_01680 [Nevskiaceae bacterium]
MSVTVGPPLLPVYEQPPIPAAGYIWTPGYWAWDGDAYYWVPGAWTIPPGPGLLWTPAWWGWNNGFYIFHPGYWGPRVGFYGGIDYGYGYAGVGYSGGYWRNGAFYYNRTVNNIHVTNIHNTYVQNVNVENRTNVTRVSYNGGPGGVRAQPRREDLASPVGRRIPATPAQIQHRERAERARLQAPPAMSREPFTPHPAQRPEPMRPQQTHREPMHREPMRRESPQAREFSARPEAAPTRRQRPPVEVRRRTEGPRHGRGQPTERREMR